MPLGLHEGQVYIDQEPARERRCKSRGPPACGLPLVPFGHGVAAPEVENAFPLGRTAIYHRPRAGKQCNKGT